MIKFRLYFDKDKETAWLNEMSNQGYALTDFFMGFYVFQKCEKGQYTYQIDFGNQFFSVSKDYREFMADAGIEIVQTWGFWVFLRKPSSEGEFQLYTDVDSQIEHYSKIRSMFKAVTILEFVCFFINFTAALTSNLPISWTCTFLLLAIVIGFINITFRTNDIIRELKERKTGIAAPGKKNVSPFLIIGLFLNAIGLLTQEYLSIYVKTPLTLLAIIFMLIGIVQVSRNNREA